MNAGVIAVLLAAGRGTRMGALTDTMPKPLLPLQGRPILEHILLGLRTAGIHKAVIVVGYRGDQIERYFGDGAALGMRLTYRRQSIADGTARAVQLARAAADDQPFLVSWGDVVIEPSQYARLVDTYRRHNADALLSLNRVEDPWRGAAVYIDPDDRVTQLIEKPPRGTSSTPWNNAGIFICAPIVWRYIDALGPSERGEYELPQAITNMIEDKRDVRAMALDGFWSDIGTPEDLAVAQTAYTLVERFGSGVGRGRSSGADASVTNHEASRIEELVARFTQQHGQRPEFVARAPGRVNLLGEHTDYNGLPVLPMAIDRSVLMAASRRRDRLVTASNVDPRFADCCFEISDQITADVAGSWTNYVKAAAQGLVGNGTALKSGATLLIDGNIPAGAGLSSSSALVVASALTLLRANDATIDKMALAEMLPRAERYVGTLSGGMDQAISLLGQADHALRIDFFPLNVRPVPLPAGYGFIVADSLVQAEKAGIAKDAYNLRVIECQLACRVLEQALADERPKIHLSTLGDLVRLFPDRPLPSFFAPVLARLPDEPLPLARVAAVLAVDTEELRRILAIPTSLPDSFAIVRRLRHVLSEAQRVNQAETALRENDIATLGTLMNASHFSCRDDYEISCPELEELVELTRGAGAVGARLTGAGFGGCTVSLVADDRVSDVLAALDHGFYTRRSADPQACRFLFKARAGAGIVELTEDAATTPAD